MYIQETMLFNAFLYTILDAEDSFRDPPFSCPWTHPAPMNKKLGY